MEELLMQLNEKDNEILNNKAILKNTDWKVVKATELGIEVDVNLKAARVEARSNINRLEIEIISLKELIKQTPQNDD